ncbi:MAG: GNAT family N-acetyltransferase [Candidatus Thermoplasmatota archaeon]
MRRFISKSVIESVDYDNFEFFTDLIKKLAHYEKQNPPDRDALKRLKQDYFDNRRFKAFLARYGEEYVGYVIFFMTYSSYLAKPTLYIEDIFVDKEYRRRGIGQKMFDFCVKQAEKHDCGRMEWCVYNWNQSAIDFYRENNAELLDKKYYRLNREQIEKHRETRR